MLVLDTPRLDFWAKRGVVERTRQLTADAYAQQLAANSWILADDNGVDVTDANAQLGQVLSRADFERKLRACNSYFIFETSLADPTKAGIYVLMPGKKFVCGFENGFIPEFSIRHFKEVEEPKMDGSGEWVKKKEFTRETRGWRTVLARLLKGRYISIAAVEHNFPSCRMSRNWHLVTH